MFTFFNFFPGIQIRILNTFQIKSDFYMTDVIVKSYTGQTTKFYYQIKIFLNDTQTPIEAWSPTSNISGLNEK